MEGECKFEKPHPFLSLLQCVLPITLMFSHLASHHFSSCRVSWNKQDLAWKASWWERKVWNHYTLGHFTVVHFQTLLIIFYFAMLQTQDMCIACKAVLGAPHLKKEQVNYSSRTELEWSNTLLCADSSSYLIGDCWLFLMQECPTMPFIPVNVLENLIFNFLCS